MDEINDTIDAYIEYKRAQIVFRKSKRYLPAFQAAKLSGEQSAKMNMQVFRFVKSKNAQAWQS